MQPASEFSLHVDRFGRWHALLGVFDGLLLLACGWTIWQWRGQPQQALMAMLAIVLLWLTLWAQRPYWQHRPFTLSHGAGGWSLEREGRRLRLAAVRCLALPGQILVLGLSERGGLALPVPSDIAGAAWRELRTRLRQ